MAHRYEIGCLNLGHTDLTCSDEREPMEPELLKKEALAALEVAKESLTALKAIKQSEDTYLARAANDQVIKALAHLSETQEALK